MASGNISVKSVLIINVESIDSLKVASREPCLTLTVEKRVYGES